MTLTDREILDLVSDPLLKKNSSVELINFARLVAKRQREIDAGIAAWVMKMLQNDVSATILAQED